MAPLRPPGIGAPEAVVKLRGLEASFHLLMSPERTNRATLQPVSMRTLATPSCITVRQGMLIRSSWASDGEGRGGRHSASTTVPTDLLIRSKDLSNFQVQQAPYAGTCEFR